MKLQTVTHAEVRSTKRNIEKFQGILISLLAVGFILLQFFPVPQMEIIISIIIIGVIVWVMPVIRGVTLVISSVLLVTGVIIMLYYNIPIQEWIKSLRINLTLVAVFLCVPLLGIPVKAGGYVEALKKVLSNKMNKPNFLFLGSKLLTHLLGVILNIGSVSIVNKLTEASNLKAPRLVANAINRGFVTTIFWSPYFSAMALVLSQLPVNWSSIVLYAIGLSMISILVSFMVERKFLISLSQSVKIDRTNSKEIDLRKDKQRVIELFILLTIMMSTVLILEIATTYSMVLIICLVSIIFPLLWCIGSGKGSFYTKEFKNHVYHGIPRLKKEIVLFLIAGFFSGAIIQTQFSAHFITLINSMFGSFTMGITFFLSLIVVLTAIVGIHPIVVITILVTSIDPELIGFSPEYFSILLLASWGISNVISPATAVSNILANLLNSNILDVSIRWNWKFVLIMLFVLPIYLMFIGV
ncbi:hypothetical protein [Alkalihalobacillus sp. BA299]|uniref:hypothetical protein n=1 Tax=Alkalihalobacillus sp. BA299 TaxID=2815938 RepID=UPI001ADB84E7|nr:hypothetical protein [Alkalihalobacillus sp. BA299]